MTVDPYSSANDKAKPASEASTLGSSRIIPATTVAKNPPTSAMRHPIQRLKAQRCQNVVLWSSIFPNIRSMYVSVFEKARIVPTPVRAEPNCSKTGDLAFDSRRFTSRAPWR